MHPPPADQQIATVTAPRLSGSREFLIDGAHLTATGIRFDAPPTDAQVKSVGTALSLMESCIDWGWADFLPQLVRTASPRASQKTPPAQLALSLVGEYATLNGRDARRLHLRHEIGRIFPIEKRRPDLTFDHYAEAYVLTGKNIEAALHWVARASDEKWSVANMRANMRAHIRASVAKREKPNGESFDNSELEISNLELASARRLRLAKTFDADEARRELEAIRNTVALVDALRARALPGKESLSNRA